MKKKRNNFGFSLTEVLLAVGTLSIGMIFVAGVFPVAIHFSTVASERTIAAVVADEAFAKVRLYGEDDPDFQIWLSAEPPGGCVDFGDVVLPNPDEFAYPSDPCNDILGTRYCWSALCRRVGDTRLVQVTVFVTRKIGSSTGYWVRNPDDSLGVRFDYPVPVPMSVLAGSNLDELVIQELDSSVHEKTFINDDYTIVDDLTGRLYRVLERLPSPDDDTIVLDGVWQGGDWVWVVPPPVNGGRYPCMAVYQKVLMF